MQEGNENTIVSHAKLVVVGAHDLREESMGALGRTFQLGDDPSSHRTIEPSKVP